MELLLYRCTIVRKETRRPGLWWHELYCTCTWLCVIFLGWCWKGFGLETYSSIWQGAFQWSGFHAGTLWELVWNIFNWRIVSNTYLNSECSIREMLFVYFLLIQSWFNFEYSEFGIGNSWNYLVNIGHKKDTNIILICVWIF